MKGTVTGIGGIFFTANDPESLKKWYESHLGVTSLFLWKEVGETNREAFTVWNVFARESSIFKNCEKDYCWNYRVDHLDTLLEKLRLNNIHSSEPTVSDENGHFGFINDPERNKIILWEPSQKIPEGTRSPLHRVTGMGGIFFKCADPAAIKEWYRLNLGLAVTEWGCSFQWIDPQEPEAKEPARTEWSTFKATSDYFKPSVKDFMLNYRVKDLRKLLQDLKSENVEVVGKMEEYSYGNFGWVVDPEGNKIELWEPLDDTTDAATT